MSRLPFTLSAMAVAIFAGCAGTESAITSAPPPVVVAPSTAPYVVAPAGTVVTPQTSASGPVLIAPSATPLRAGMGRIESIQVVPAAAGATVANSNRVVTRMDDGSVQYFNTQAMGLAVGDRIEITKNGTMRHPA
jgi:hypothetical protein